MKIIKRLKMVTALLVLVTTVSMNAQETITLDRFNELSVTGIIEVELEQGEEEKVVIYNDSGIDRDEIKVKVEQGELKIRVLKSLIKDSDDIRVVVTYKQLRAVKASAGAELTVKNTIKADHFHLKANSGAEVVLDLDVNDLEASAAEGAEIELSGRTETQEVNISSGAEYHALRFSCNHAYAKANTGGYAELIAHESLEAAANTGGRIKYKGNPAKVKIKDILGGEVDEL